ncbi:MAG: hypothetical protein NC112_04065 [Oxalobacter formigenes]|nr:hypothetical protein [Oxalobacter formigenes]
MTASSNKILNLFLFSFLAIAFFLAKTGNCQSRPLFEDYPVREIYTGEFHLPDDLTKEVANDPITKTFEDITWRNEVGKRINSPEINFAGKYYLFINSLGTLAHYYRMIDLSTGKYVSNTDIFDSSEIHYMRTRRGYRCLTRLFTKPDSRLVLAQCTDARLIDNPECEARYFLLDNNRKFRPLTKKRYSCIEPF